MIEGIKEIGEIIISEPPHKFIESLILNVPSERKGKKQHIVIIKFDSKNGTINFDFEEIKGKTARKYLWIGNADSNNPQDRFTTSNLEYLVSQTIPNMRTKLGEELAKLFEKFIGKFYYNTGAQEKQKKRYRYIWDIGKTRIISEEKKVLWEKIVNGAKKDEICECLNDLKSKNVLKKNEIANWENALNNPKEMVNIASREIYEHFKREKGFKKDAIALFTLKVDGQLIVNKQEYREYLDSSIVEELFSDKVTGVCYLCQKDDEVIHNMTIFDFKYYITDKIGFSSGLQ